MRLGRDALIFTKNGGCQSVGMLSQTYLHNIKAQAVIVPIVPFNQQTNILTSNRWEQDFKPQPTYWVCLLWSTVCCQSDPYCKLHCKLFECHVVTRFLCKYTDRVQGCDRKLVLQVCTKKKQDVCILHCVIPLIHHHSCWLWLKTQQPAWQPFWNTPSSAQRSRYTLTLTLFAPKKAPRS